MDKFEIAYMAMSSIEPDEKRSVLDVGCRDCIFSRKLPAGWRYEGLDLFQNDAGTVTFVQSVEEGIRAPDRAYSAVVALDVVEHVDKMSAVMDELWRVTDRKLIVALPNMAYALFRLQYLLSGNMGDKYRLLPYGQDEGDRHRWLTTANESIRYMREFAAANEPGIKLTWESTLETGRRRLFAKMTRALGFSQQLHAPTLVFSLERTS